MNLSDKAQPSSAFISHRQSFALVVIVCLSLNVFSGFAFLSFPFLYPDLGETLYHAREIVTGKVPYRDFFTHHFVGYLLPFVLVEAFRPVQILEVTTLAIVHNLVSALLIYGAASQFQSRFAATMVALISSSIGWFPGWNGYIFNVPSYILPWLNLFIFLLCKSIRTQQPKYLLFTGLSYGLVLIFDQRIVFFSPLLLLAFLKIKLERRGQFLCLLTISILIVPAVVLTFLVYHGAFSDFVFQTLQYPFEYRNKGREDVVWNDICLLLHEVFQGEQIPLLMAIFGGFYLVTSSASVTIKIINVLLGAGSLLYMIAGGRFFLHYAVILTPVTILNIGWAFEAIVNLKQQAIKFVCLGTIVSCFALNYWRDTMMFWNVKRPLPAVENIRKIGDFLKDNSAETDRVLIWDYSPQIYAFARRFSGFRDLSLVTFTGTNPDSINEEKQGIVPEMRHEFLEYINNRPPKLIVLYNDYFFEEIRKGERDFYRAKHLSFFREVLETRYERIKVFENGIDKRGYAEIFENRADFNPKN